MFTILFFASTLLAAAQGQSTTDNVIITLNQTEIRIVESIVDTVIHANNYIIQFVEVIVKFLKSITRIVNNIQNNNETFINFTDISSMIQDILNTTNDKCINNEESSVKNLVISTTTNIEICYSNVSKNVNELIPDLEVLLEAVIGTISNVSQGVNKCFNNNTFLLGLPGCLLVEYEDAYNDYMFIRQQFNDTVTIGRTIAKNFVSDTNTCAKEIVTAFLTELAKIMTNFVDCVLSN